MRSVDTRMTTLRIFLFKLCPLIAIITLFSFLGHNSGTIRNILNVLGRIVEQVNLKGHMQE